MDRDGSRYTATLAGIGIAAALLVAAGYLGIQQVLAVHNRRMNFAAMDRAQKVVFARKDRDRGAELQLAHGQYELIVIEVNDVLAAIDAPGGQQ